MSVCFTVLYTSLALTVWQQNLNGSHIKADRYINMTFSLLIAHRVLHVYVTFGAKGLMFIYCVLKCVVLKLIALQVLKCRVVISVLYILCSFYHTGKRVKVKFVDLNLLAPEFYI
jgi:hypothetical protein